MNNYNRINLSLIPVDGADPEIYCSRCPSACCREGVALPLTKGEAQMLSDAGTDLQQLPKSDHKGNRAGFGKSFYQLKSDCGNLVIDQEGTYCGAYETNERPQICKKFDAGTLACAGMQVARVGRGQDTFVDID